MSSIDSPISTSRKSDPTKPTFTRAVSLPPDSRISVYHGTVPDPDNLAWTCDGCRHAPTSLLSPSGSMYVDFYSGEASEDDSGFAAYYSSVLSEPGESAPAADDIPRSLLTMPSEDRIQSPSNFVWEVMANDEADEIQGGVDELLEVGRWVGGKCDEDVLDLMVDGSSGSIEEVRKTDLISLCGVVSHQNRSGVKLVGEGSEMLLNGEFTSGSEKLFFGGWGEGGEGTCSHEFSLQDDGVFASASEAVLPQAKVCQYIVKQSRITAESVKLKLDNMVVSTGVSVGVFSGATELGRPLFVCGPEFVYPTYPENSCACPIDVGPPHTQTDPPRSPGDDQYGPRGPIPPYDVFAYSSEGMCVTRALRPRKNWEHR